MPASLANSLSERIDRLSPADSDHAARTVDEILAWGREHAASDIHLQPTADGLELKCRIDGVLRLVRRFPAAFGGKLVCRLKVMAELLTYQTDLPQEGRIRDSAENASRSRAASRFWAESGSRAASDSPAESPNARSIEMRVSTFPTLHGERAVIRLFSGGGRYEHLDDLGFPPGVAARLRQCLGETSGAILACGPAGSGKTTTVYACLREIAAAADGGRSLVSLEDPIEVALDGVAQSQVQPRNGFDLTTGLRFLMRQDPEIILVGEIRDRATAEAAMEASLTGHLLLSTFHAGSVAEALGRLADMDIEPYVIRGGVLAVVSQRLVRRLCRCARASDRPEDRLGLDVAAVHLPVGCPECLGTGYRQRLPLVEMIDTRDAELGAAILGRADVQALHDAAVRAGMIAQEQRARELVETAQTSPAEIRRVLGEGRGARGGGRGTRGGGRGTRGGGRGARGGEHEI